ncbi:anti-sigma B factor antagonist [Ruminococcus sp. YRD2003]|uniref:STAS domain-containing protein n=1 Tax=Ruminococcus sp. YRD2003 TaxID=1452313 RepID=UPI0008C16494|nr:STAS domain-containing protein [Ruminococcus sp.]SEK80596.1 anti-sigma B factor antagonist [Ruminococcus flavefaciens]
MEFNVITSGNKMVIELEGRLDTITAPKLDTYIRKSLEGIGELCIDMEKLEYISSAGLRVLLAAQKIMDGQGRMVITGCREEILEIFDITGFTDILTIE